MTPAEIDRVFGRGRLRMTTGEHVEVFREEARDGEERRYSKRFLETASGDFRPWTEREWRILDRLGARGDAAVARVVRFFPADDTGMPRLQTKDAGPTVDQWASLLALRRTAPVLPYVFGDCANWWALARQCLIAFEPLHALGFVHLDFKADNVCVPWKPAQAALPAAGQPMTPDFDGLALIDVAFSLLPGVALPGGLPLAREAGFEYQSPRLLEALDDGRRGDLASTLDLDWRCDLFSLAAMLWRYLPELDEIAGTGWTSQRHEAATAFVRQLLEIHGEPLATARPHRALISQAALWLADPQLSAALQAGSSFDPERAWPNGAEATPLTRVVATPVAPRREHVEPVFFTSTVATDVPRPIVAAATAIEPTMPMAANEPIAPPPVADDEVGVAIGAPVDVPIDLQVDLPLDLPIDLPLEAPVARHIDVPLEAPVARALDDSTSLPPLPAVDDSPTARNDARSAESLAGATTSVLAAAVAGAAAATAASARAAASRHSTVATAADTAEPPWQPVGDREPALPRSAATTGRESSSRDATSADATPPSTSAATPPSTSWPPLGAARDPATRVELPRLPASSPVPILAAAGAGALVVALAAWWQLDGRARFDTGVPSVGAAASSAAVVPMLPESVAAASAPDDPTTAAASPTFERDASSSASPLAPTAAASAPSESASATASESESASSETERNGSEPAAAEQRTVVPAALEASAAGWMRDRLPRMAQTAERRLAPVLAIAARSPELRRRSEIRTAAQAARIAAVAPPGVAVQAREAKSLNDAGQAAYWHDSNLADAIHLQTQAFGANPLDPEVAGNLALLHLKEQPPRAEPARQLALHALTLKDDRFPTGRIDDWTTFAIAAALTGRDGDARNAWFVSMALTSDLQHQCNAALRAQAVYGERVRPSVQAMLQRARSSAAYGRCELPQAVPAGKRDGRNVKSRSAQKARRAIP